jgi:hypothetical protein
LNTLKTIMLGLVAMLAGNALAFDKLELDRRIHVLAAPQKTRNRDLAGPAIILTADL